MTKALGENIVIEKWHMEMNAEENLPPMAFRRNVPIYTLVSYINNIVACYISKNFIPIPVFIERSRYYMEKNPPNEKNTPYYQRVKFYLEVMEKHLVEYGIEVKRI